MITRKLAVKLQGISLAAQKLVLVRLRMGKTTLFRHNASTLMECDGGFHVSGCLVVMAA